jgi:hypothetical protein
MERNDLRFSLGWRRNVDYMHKGGHRAIDEMRVESSDVSHLAIRNEYYEYGFDSTAEIAADMQF